MPSFQRHSTMPTVIHTKKAAPAAKVQWPESDSPVTSIIRPLSNIENWALYNFETHAQACPSCHNPYDVARSGHKLCDEGHKLAQNVAQFLYTKQDGLTYSQKGEESKLVRVEMPANYDQTRGLLRAIERSMRRQKTPFVSQDRTYFVADRAPRLPERTRSAKVEQTPKIARPQRSATDIVDWPSRERSATIDVSKRGSLYESDMAEQRKAYPRYNVQVREPSRKDVREHRRSGYYV